MDPLLEGPAFYADPYPVFRRLREESPVHWHSAAKSWLISRYDDAELVLRRPQQFSSYGFQNQYLASLRPELRSVIPTLELKSKTPTLITSDPPAHTRLRRLLQVGFTPRAIEALRPRVQAVVDELLEACRGADDIEFVSAFAYPLPAIVLAEIMGVPREDRDLFKTTSGEHVRFMNRANPNSELTVELAQHLDRSLSDFRAYLEDLMEARRRQPQDDIVTTLVSAEFDGDKLAQQEALWNLVLFLIAGHETTTNMIANGLMLLLRHPEQLAQVRADSELLPAALEEILRFESPVQRVKRVVAEDVELAGVRLRAGQPAEVLIGAANRDSSKWVDADRFAITRQAIPHLAFGKGVHFCIGAGLARLEATVAFTSLLQRFETMQLVDEPEWMCLTNLRTLTRLPVRVR